MARLLPYALFLVLPWEHYCCVRGMLFVTIFVVFSLGAITSIFLGDGSVQTPKKAIYWGCGFVDYRHTYKCLGK